MASSCILPPLQANLQNNYFNNLLPFLSGKRSSLIKKENKYGSTISLLASSKGRRDFTLGTNRSDLFVEVTPEIARNSGDYLDQDIDDKMSELGHPDAWVTSFNILWTVCGFTDDSDTASSLKNLTFTLDASFEARCEEGNCNREASWIQTYLPRRARPYAYLMRLDKMSAGPWVFAFPCLWAIGLTAEAGTIADVKIMAFFTLVMFITRAIACTINDYFDRDIDAKVERTKQRPLASGELTPFQGLCFLGLQVLSCYGLLLVVNNLSRTLWLSSQVLLFTYPLLKRVTYWPQAYLGLAINSLPLCCWAAVKGGLDAHVLVPLCFSAFCWTLVYETIYSHQDKKDDAKIGVKTPALLLRDSTKIWTTAFAVACIGGFAITGVNASIGWPYYFLLAAASSHFAWQILSVNLNSPADCFRKFESNVQFGAIILCGILLGRLFQ